MAQSNNDKPATTIQKIGLGCSWIVLIFITLIMFVPSKTWGICFTIGGIFVIFLANVKSNQPVNNQSEKPIVRKSIFSTHISKEYFDKITYAVEKIVSQLENLSNDKNFLKFV